MGKKRVFTIAEMFGEEHVKKYDSSYGGHIPCKLVDIDKESSIRRLEANGFNLNEPIIIKYLSFVNGKVSFVTLAQCRENEIHTRAFSFGYYTTFKIKLLTKVEYREFINKYRKLYNLKNVPTNIAHSFSSGSDPEVFVEDKEGLLPAFEFLPERDKAKANGSVEAFWDGFQAEFTHDPANCLDSVTARIRRGLKTINDAAKRVNEDAKVTLTNTVNIEQEQLDNATDDQVAFACDPSLNVYGMKGIEVPARVMPMRTSGGHLHFGIGKKSPEVIERIVKSLDAILGVACVSLFEGIDNPARRQMYGLAGEYRLPKHGIEYRTLSNAWLCHPTITYMVFDLARKAVVIGEQDLLKEFKALERTVIRVINTCDVKGARRIMRQNKNLYLLLFKSMYKDYAEIAYNIFYKGVNKYVVDPNDLESNWDLGSETWLGMSARFARRAECKIVDVKNGSLTGKHAA